MRHIDKIGKPIVIRPKKVLEATPCAMELTTLLNCWRALATDASQCNDSAKALTQCMARRVLNLRILLDIYKIIQLFSYPCFNRNSLGQRTVTKEGLGTGNQQVVG